MLHRCKYWLIEYHAIVDVLIHYCGIVIFYTLLGDILMHSVHFQNYNDIHELVIGC